MAEGCEEVPSTDSVIMSLSEGLDEQRRDGAFCDLILKLHGRSVATHSCVMAIFSPWIMSMITHNRHWPYVQSAPMEIELDICGDEGLFDALQTVIGYLYTGKMDVHENTVDKVLKVAEVLQVGIVTSQCSSWKFVNGQQKIASSGMELPQPSVIEDTTEKVAQKLEPPPTTALLPPSSLPRRSCRNKKSTMSGSRQPTQDFTSDGSEVDDDDRDADVSTATAVLQRNGNRDGSYACCKCPFKSTSALEMQDHRRVHWGKSYRCNNCGFLAIQAPKLLAHLSETCHSGTVCSLCNFEAQTAEKMEAHLKQHNDRKPFFCGSCDQRFKTRTALGLHLPKHSTNAPYVCEVCAKGFKWKHALQSHMVVHSDSKQYLCDQCGYTTAHKSSLKSHRLLHTGNMYKCPYPGCSFQSVRKQNLKQHTVTHTKEKPYRCGICNQTFSLLKNMRRHARMHNSDINQLRCEQCPFTTTRADKLKQHSRKYHYHDDAGEDGAQQEHFVEGSLDILMVAVAREHALDSSGEINDKSVVEASSNVEIPSTVSHTSASLVTDVHIADVLYSLQQ